MCVISVNIFFFLKFTNVIDVIHCFSLTSALVVTFVFLCGAYLLHDPGFTVSLQSEDYSIKTHGLSALKKDVIVNSFIEKTKQ